MTRLRRHEQVTVLKVPANTADQIFLTAIKPASFSLLANIAKSFERSVWRSLVFYYKPAVATTFGGLVAYGVDWSSKLAVKDLDRKKVCALSPVCTHAAWMDSERTPLRLPRQLLQSRKFYLHESAEVEDAGPGTLVVSASVAQSANEVVLGEIWAYYDIELIGTKSA